MMTELVHRKVDPSYQSSTSSNPVEKELDDDDIEPIPCKPSGAGLYSTKTYQDDKILNSALKNLNPRWKNWTIRTIFTLLMLGGFIYIIYLGQIAIMFLLIGIFLKCFNEVMKIGYHVFKSDNLPCFNVICYYYFVVHNYYFFGETFYSKYRSDLISIDIFAYLIPYHR